VGHICSFHFCAFVVNDLQDFERSLAFTFLSDVKRRQDFLMNDSLMDW